MPPPPHPQSTPDVARSRSHRGAAGRLGGGTNCWCGTAAAQQPAEGWCPTWVERLGVRRSASSICASPGAPKRWLAADVTTFASIYMELRPARLRGGFLRVCHLHFDLDGRSAGSTPCLRRRRGGDGRVMRAHFSIPNPNSRFSFHRSLAVWVIPHFCVQITE